MYLILQALLQIIRVNMRDALGTEFVFLSAPIHTILVDVTKDTQERIAQNIVSMDPLS